MGDKEREAYAKIAEIKGRIEQLYNEAAAIADEHGLYFSYDGPAGYGDGGYYEDGEWRASSNSC